MLSHSVYLFQFFPSLQCLLFRSLQKSRPKLMQANMSQTIISFGLNAIVVGRVSRNIMPV